MISNIESKWYIFYLCPRTEKKVYNDLWIKKYEVFLPVTKKLSIWKNRQKKIIEVPLFPGYIFVNTTETEIYAIVRLSKVVKCLCFNNRPSSLSNKEIDTIKKMIESGNNIVVGNQFLIGDKVKIIIGPLTGYEGILVMEKGKSRFGIQFEEINNTMLIDIDKANIIAI